jgi:ribosomal protein S8
MKPRIARSKYGSRKTKVDGIIFASQKEATRYGILKLLQNEGKIRDLKLQVRFKLVQTVTYVADFEYYEKGRRVVEDVKGFKTPVYKRKRKLMKEQHGIEILET